jgi:hypothetical protein
MTSYHKPLLKRILSINKNKFLPTGNAYIQLTFHHKTLSIMQIIYFKMLLDVTSHCLVYSLFLKRSNSFTRSKENTDTGILPVLPGSAICVQNFDDSLNSAIRMTYRSSQRSSSMCEPRHPLLKVVLCQMTQFA